MKDKRLQNLYAASNFESMGQQIIQQLSDHIASTTSGEHSKTLQWNDPERELEFWKDFLENGNNEDFFSEILKRTTHTHNPKYIGHQVAATAPITTLTAMVSALLNNGMAVFEMGMSPSAIEKIVTDSICKRIGYDDNAAGFLTSGGSLANLTALLSARKAIVAHDIWNEGLQKPLGILVCEEAHYCVDRAAKIMGLGEKGIIKVPAQENFSMDVTLLDNYYEKATKLGLEIFAVIGSAPSTATGAHDNLEAIAQFAKRKNIWFHVDGAHGGAAIYSEKYKHLLKGIDQADSVVIDGHKMMLMPAVTTALLFKDQKYAKHTFSQKADYLLNEEEEEHWINSGKKTFECTKYMMCLHWFILLKYYGEEIFDAFLTNQYNLSLEFADMISQQKDFELAVQPMSNIVCFRFIEDGLADAELNRLNANIRQNLLEDGEFYLVQTKLRGEHFLRTTLMNPFTTTNHLWQLLEKIKDVASNHLN